MRAKLDFHGCAVTLGNCCLLMHDPRSTTRSQEYALTKPRSRVLLVDDERGIRVALRRVLAQGGLDVVTAASGEEAIQAIEDEPRFDVVLTDIKMPGMDGLELMRVVRSLDPEVPIVVLTGHRDAQATAALQEAGASTCLDKPVEGDLLLHTLRNLIEDRVPVSESRATSLDERQRARQSKA